MNNAHTSNYAAERFAAHSPEVYAVEDAAIEHIEILPAVAAKTYDEPFGYGAYDDSDDNKFEMNLNSCTRAFDNSFNDE